jgi:hypothetical protein
VTLAAKFDERQVKCQALQLVQDAQSQSSKKEVGQTNDH